MTIFYKRFFIFLTIFVSIALSANASVKLTGTIFDEATGQTLPDANIQIEALSVGTASQDGGFFALENLEPGNYTVHISVIGYEWKDQSVELAKDQSLNIGLKQKAIEMAPVLVTATLSEHLISEVPHSADVLTEARMVQMNGNTPGELLESITGIYAKSYDGLAGLQTPSIRGANADQVVVLMDGVRLNTAQGGGVDLNLFPSSALDRIEVVRGAHSAILGSDAIGGAIHLRSKELSVSQDFNLGIQSTLGSFGTQMVQVQGAKRIGAMSLLVNFSKMNSDGNFTFEDPISGKNIARKNNDYAGNNLFLKSNYVFNIRNQLQLIYQKLNTDKGVAGSVNAGWDGLPMTTPEARSQYDRGLIALSSRNQVTDQLRLTSQVNYQDFEYAYQDPAGWTPADDVHENKSMQFNLMASWTQNPFINFSAGADIRKDQLESTQITADDRTVTGGFAQANVTSPVSLGNLKTHWVLIPAVRYDHYSDVDDQISPQIGLKVGTGETVQFALKGNYGLAYRVPSFNDLYWPEDAYTKGNPNLKPESSKNLDVGIEVSGDVAGYIQAEVTYFNNRVEDLINWQPLPDNEFVYMPTNIGIAKLAGVETSLQYTLPNNAAYLRIAHTFMEATDETKKSDNKGNTLIYRPKNKLDVTAGIQMKMIMANLNYRTVSKRFTTADNLLFLDAYSLLNANIGVSHQLMGTTLKAKVQAINLLDKSIFINDGYPLPGREVRVTVGIDY